MLVDAYGLTARQRELLGRLLLGRSMTQLAHSLDISEYTAQDHRKAIYRRMGVSSRSELAALLQFRPEGVRRRPAESIRRILGRAAHGRYEAAADSPCGPIQITRAGVSSYATPDRSTDLRRGGSRSPTKVAARRLLFAFPPLTSS
jgi:DNA-binding CsgD family transcriptional regulator